MTKYNSIHIPIPMSISKKSLLQTAKSYAFKHKSHIELDWYLKRGKRRSRQLRHNYKFIIAELANKSTFIKPLNRLDQGSSFSSKLKMKK